MNRIKLSCRLITKERDLRLLILSEILLNAFAEVNVKLLPNKYVSEELYQLNSTARVDGIVVQNKNIALPWL